MDRIIPPDESVPLRGSTFRDWQDQVAPMRKALLPTVLEARAALEPNAPVEHAGHCPHCDPRHARGHVIPMERQRRRDLGTPGHVPRPEIAPVAEAPLG